MISKNPMDEGPFHGNFMFNDPLASPPHHEFPPTGWHTSCKSVRHAPNTSPRPPAGLRQVHLRSQNAPACDWYLYRSELRLREGRGSGCGCSLAYLPALRFAEQARALSRQDRSDEHPDMPVVCRGCSAHGPAGREKLGSMNYASTVVHGHCLFERSRYYFDIGLHLGPDPMISALTKNRHPARVPGLLALTACRDTGMFENNEHYLDL